MKKRIGWIVTLLVVVAAGVFFWRYRSAHHAPDVTYKTTAAAPHKIVGKVTASGTLSAIVTVQVGTQVSGRIQKLLANFNSQVKKGELVAKIDPQLFEAAVAQSQANYLQAQASIVNAEAQAKNADLQLARTKALHDQNLAAQADLDTATATAAMAHAGIDMQRANLAQAAASLHQAQVNLSYTSIMSPIDGVVISRSVDVGQTVAASLSAPTLFTIAQDLTKMQVDSNVAEGDVGRLQVGMATYFTVDSFPGQKFRGKIREIRNSATTVQSVVTYDAVIDVENSDLKLRPGMTANVTVIYAQRDNALSIPNAALRFRPPASVASASPPPVASGVASAVASGSPSGAASGSPSGSPSAVASGASSAAPDGPSPGGGRGHKSHAKADDSADPKTIWVLRDGTPQPISAHTGLTDGTFTEVVDGDLKEGDLVITEAVTSGDSSPAPSSTSRMPRGF